MPKKLKKINFEIIHQNDGKHQPEPYKILAEAREKWHTDLYQAKIALAWRKNLKPDVDGHMKLGMCVKASDLHREFWEWDFIILLNKEVWEDPEFTKERKLALMDHELCHAAPSLDKDLDNRTDERGRQVWRIRRHDIEEFQSVVAHHGCYKQDLERFAESLMKKRNTPPLLKAIEKLKAEGTTVEIRQ